MMMFRSQLFQKSGIGGLVLLFAATMTLVGTPIHEVKAQPPGSDEARELLDQARELYEELLPMAQQLGDAAMMTRLRNLRTQWVQAQGHMQGRRYQQAGTMARQNLQQLRQLSVQIRQLAQRLPHYTRLSERNLEMMQFLQNSVGTDAPPEVIRQLALSADTLRRARQARQQNNLMLSFRLMEQADNMLRQVLRHVDRSGLTSESVQREIDETTRRIDRLDSGEINVDTAIEALERARTSQAEAVHLHAAGDLRQALAHTLTARTALRLAERLTLGSLTSDDVAMAIAHAEELMEAHSELTTSPIQGVSRLMQQATRQLDQARTRLMSGNLRQALEDAQSAAKLIMTAVRRAGGSVPPPPPALKG
ncbi:hypothetical protein ACFL6T_00575 [Candidatus Zixiibacteriota bacterium]